MALAKNVIENMTNNDCYLYNCHELHEEFKQVIEKYNDKKFFIYKRLVEHFGRIISQKKDSFVGELGYDSQYTLINGIFKVLFCKVKSRKRYEENGEIFVTFFAMLL